MGRGCGTKLAYEWKSRKFITAPPLNYGAAKIDADFEMSEAEAGFRPGIPMMPRLPQTRHWLPPAQWMTDLADSALGEYEIGGDAMQAIPPLLSIRCNSSYGRMAC